MKKISKKYKVKYTIGFSPKMLEDVVDYRGKNALDAREYAEKVISKRVGKDVIIDSITPIVNITERKKKIEQNKIKQNKKEESKQRKNRQQMIDDYIYQRLKNDHILKEEIKNKNIKDKRQIVKLIGLYDKMKLGIIDEAPQEDIDLIKTLKSRKMAQNMQSDLQPNMQPNINNNQQDSNLQQPIDLTQPNQQNKQDLTPMKITGRDLFQAIQINPNILNILSQVPQVIKIISEGTLNVGQVSPKEVEIALKLNPSNLEKIANLPEVVETLQGTFKQSSNNDIVKTADIPLPEEHKQSMMKQNIYFIQNELNDLPNTKKVAVKNMIRDFMASGAIQFLKEVNFTEFIRLPAIVFADPRKVAKIKGKEYYIISVSKSGIKALEKGTGNLVVFDPKEISREDIELADKPKEHTLKEFNNEIKEYNKKIKSIQKHKGLTRLNLQLTYVIDRINNRLDTLKGQENSIQNKLKQPKELFAPYYDFENFLKEGIENGDFSEKDIFDTILFLYQNQPQKFFEDIENNSIVIPDQLKEPLTKIMNLVLESKQKSEEKTEKSDFDRQQRIQEELNPEDKIEDMELQELTKDQIKGKMPYGKFERNRSIHTMFKSLYITLGKIKRDKDELIKVKESAENLRSYLANLNVGERTNSYLESEEGKIILKDVEKMLDEMKIFVKRYKIQIFSEEGIVSDKLFGKNSTAGNAILAMQISKILLAIYESVNQHKENSVEMEKDSIDDIKVNASIIEDVKRITKKPMNLIRDLGDLSETHDIKKFVEDYTEPLKKYVNRKHGFKDNITNDFLEEIVLMDETLSEFAKSKGYKLF